MRGTLIAASICMLVILLVRPVPAVSQTWTSIAKTSTTFHDFVGSGEGSDSYYTFYLPFASGTGRSSDFGCWFPYLPYSWYDYLASDSTSAEPPRIWMGNGQGGPLSGYVQRQPSTLYISNSTYALKGIQFSGAFGGKITDNSDPDYSTNAKDALTEAYFAHTRSCYDGGPEFGFYRQLIHPGSTTEQGTIYFYYSDRTNCGGHAWGYQDSLSGPLVYQSTCYDPSQGAFVDPLLGSVVAIPIPGSLNSQGEWDYTYRAYLSDDHTFQIEVRDPYNDSLIWSTSTSVAGTFFSSYAQQMWSGTFSAYVTLTMNKSLDRDSSYNNRGDITPSTFDYPAVGARSISVAQ